MPHHATHTARGGAFGRMALPLAVGAIAGLALSQGRKLAMQAPSIAAGDWSDALRAEHRMVEKLFETLLGTREDETMKRNTLLGKIAYALTKHATEEENVIYPALKRAQPDGAAGHLVDEHAQIKSFIFELKEMDAADPRWIVRAREFQQLVERHVREEEDEIFPGLYASLSQEENARLTKMMNWEGYKVA